METGEHNAVYSKPALEISADPATELSPQPQVAAVEPTTAINVLLLEKRLETLSKLSADFLALLIVSTVIATLGLFQNNSGVIIGAMIIAPMMRPLSGLSLGILTRDTLLLKRACITLCTGTLLAMVIASSLALLLQQLQLTPEIMARTKPNLLDLGVAFFAGAIAAYCQCKERLSESLAGVAIAVALVPPLAVAGVGMALSKAEIWQGALLLYLTNLVGITLAGSLVFLVAGYGALRKAKRGLFISVAFLLLLCVPLAFSMNDMLLESRLSATVKQVLQEKTHTFKNVRLRDVEVNRFHKPCLVIATVFSKQEVNGNQVRLVQNFLSKELSIPVEFRLRAIGMTEIGAEDPTEKRAASLSDSPLSGSQPDQQPATSPQAEIPQASGGGETATAADVPVKGLTDYAQPGHDTVDKGADSSLHPESQVPAVDK